ncbi:MAG: hypothetical protein JW725_04865 [Candidatus Babeliaceae bacterium]|nr:hypothetical protein [Candidatus Babeliaceae bacterium]
MRRIVSLALLTGLIFSSALSAKVLSSPDGIDFAKPSLPLVVKFFATWCGPCSATNALFEGASAALEGKAIFVKVDIDKYRSLANKYGVRSIPTFVFIGTDGAEKGRSVGGNTTQSQLVAKATSLFNLG